MSTTPRKRTKRAKRPIETPDYLKFCRRVIRAAGRRVAGESEVDLADLAGLRDVYDEAVRIAVTGLRKQGHSWAYISTGLGVTPEAARQRFGGETLRLVAG